MSFLSRIFGFNEKDKNEKPQITVDSLPDGTITIDDNHSSMMGDFNIIRQDIADLPRTEVDSIMRYRQLALSAEVSEAVQEIVNETFVIDGVEKAITLEFREDSDISKQLQDKIIDAYDYVYHDLFDFDGTGKNLFSSWYIDSRIFLHKVIEDNGKTIKKLQQIDPLNIRRIRKQKVTQDGFLDLTGTTVQYIYVPNQLKRDLWKQNFQDIGWEKQRNAALFEENAIAYSDSGLVSEDGSYVIGHLNKVVVPYNNMKMMESAMVIYRVVRAPERRVFYIDVADLPRTKAESYMNDLINKFKNKMVYDTKTGQTIEKRNLSHMLEDIWLPRRSNGRSTEVSTLQGGQNTGVTEDVEYCRDVFYRSLNIPRSRFSSDQNPFGTGRITEITRDEYRFYKFIQSLRARFILLVEDVLKTELLLRNIITDDDWNNLKRQFQWVYAEDSNITEMKKTEIMEARINTLNSVDGMINKLFSPKWALQNIMRMTDAEIETELDEIEKYKARFPDVESFENYAGSYEKPDNSVGGTSDDTDSYDDNSGVEKSEVINKKVTIKTEEG